MKYLVISGSHRTQSQSEKVSRYIADGLRTVGGDASVLSLANNPLPLWSEDVWEKTDEWQATWSPISTQLEEADAYVIVTPEWGGMVPPGLKNLLLLSGSELAHKPALVVAVSSGVGGAYPIAELRMSGYKNNHICFIPSQLIIRNVEEVLNGVDSEVSASETKLRERIDHCLKLLGVYAEAFVAIRGTKVVDLKRYPYGM